jgi:hypothetical protein
MYFCRYDAIESESRRIFGAIADDNYLVGLSRDSFIIRLAEHWGEVNAVHPFRHAVRRRSVAAPSTSARIPQPPMITRSRISSPLTCADLVTRVMASIA